MKKIVLLTALFAFGIAAQAQEVAKTTSTATAKTEVKKVKRIKKSKKPAIELVEGVSVVFENEVIDYGIIEQGANGEREFKLVNNGKQPLIIVSALGSCGCTVPEAPKEPIASGASSVIKVKYDTNRPGVFQKTVTVTTNASDKPKVLTIKGEVKAAAKTS